MDAPAAEDVADGNDAAAATTPKPLRAYVQNVCVLPAGMREPFLIQSILCLYPAVCVAAGYATGSVAWPLRVAILAAVVGTGLAMVLVVHAVSCCLGIATGGCCPSRGQDYKRERLEELARKLSTPDGRPRYAQRW